MGRAAATDLAVTFADALAVACSAPSATAGWRAICARERRRLGSRLATPLSELDLDEDTREVGKVARYVAATAARDIDVLLFGLFDGIDDGDGAFGGCHVSGIATHGRAIADVMRDPWLPARHFVKSPVLDRIVSLGAAAHRDVRGVVDHPLRFMAAALIARFACRGLEQRVVVSFDDDARAVAARAPRFAEITARPCLAKPARDAAFPVRSVLAWA